MEVFNLNEFRDARVPSEAEVMASWQENVERPVVSIVCLTYNQERYIDDAIRGFLIQKTDFPFEIIVNDDASTDSTAEKIREYWRKYPKIIKPIIQKENQYSKSPYGLLCKVIQETRGNYIALCEGDDFWITTDKLQRQLNAMQDNPEIKICFHRNFQGNTDKGEEAFFETPRSRFLYPNRQSILSTKVIILGDGDYMHTASIMMTRDAMDNLPGWLSDCPFGDYFIQIMGAADSGALYIPELMSFYRMTAVGSWSSRKIIPESQHRLICQMHHSLKVLNQELKGRYETEISIMLEKLRHHYLSEISNVLFLKDSPDSPIKKFMPRLMRYFFTRYIPISSRMRTQYTKLKRYLIIKHSILTLRQQVHRHSLSSRPGPRY
ncbi:glycosyltransferase family 2 protein [Pseudomonas sp. GCM10022186]|uniref:glycosyltransferase family 2 protein n=1 Tax=Pseudomonas sp. GCM10022186 TaxID=3252650 RepID=UPI00361D54DA